MTLMLFLSNVSFSLVKKKPKHFKDQTYQLMARLANNVTISTDLSIKIMFGSSLPPVVGRRAHVLFTLFVFVSA